MSASFTPPPPPLAVAGISSSATHVPPPDADSPYFSSASASSASPSSVITVMIIITSAVILSASIYLLLRVLSKRASSSSSTSSAVLHRDAQKCHVASKALLESLPLFSFGSVTGNLSGGDCAVCLSKFETQDQLRLLPLCCHAFHAECIDTWIASNQTCPLCRSTVFSSGADALDKFLSTVNGGTNDTDSSGNGNRGSFRIEIGSVSRRRGVEAEDVEEARRRSYSVGSFEYILDDNAYEVSVECTTHHRGGISNFSSNAKDSSVGVLIPEQPGEVLAAEVSGGRNWLRDYVDRLSSVSISSRATSFRSSGRFFTGSSRRSEAAVVPEDLEANPVGEEISVLFRWLSGI